MTINSVLNEIKNRVRRETNKYADKRMTKKLKQEFLENTKNIVINVLKKRSIWGRLDKKDKKFIEDIFQI